MEKKQYGKIKQILIGLFWCSWNGHNKTLVKFQIEQNKHVTGYYCSVCNKILLPKDNDQ